MRKPLNRLILWIPMTFLALVGLATISLLAVGGFVGAIANGPPVVASEASPDGEYAAYAVDHPSLDGPNQTLYVEHKDKLQFMLVDQLVEDVDRVETIHWSPDGDVVVFVTRYNLIAMRVPTWEMIEIFRARNWYRTAATRNSAMGPSGQPRAIESIVFPEPDVVQYRLKGSDQEHVVRLPPPGSGEPPPPPGRKAA